MSENNNRDIAVIGISLRLPFSNTVDEFWENLVNGKECLNIKSTNNSDLAVNSENFNNKSRFSTINDIDLFDAKFFNYSSKDASTIDPQFRLLLECAWHALEDSGYNPEKYNEEIGIYASSYYSSYLIENVLPHLDRDKLEEDQFSSIYQCLNDYLATNIAYKLQLTGPSLTVQSWCTSALSTIHLACQSLRNNECGIAMAGGVSILVPSDKFWYQDENSMPKDGHTCSFDKNGHGNILANGLGIVVLKRLKDAIRDRDQVYAVIKGTGMTNDGRSNQKLSYQGITVDGQYRAIKKAFTDADINPDSIFYVEANGLATELSDRLEIAALSKGYSGKDQERSNLLIGSVKSNYGHLTAASGIPCFVKACLSLKNGTIPPSINFSEFNSKSISKGNFMHVNNKLFTWEKNNTKKRIGLNSFGFGGSNIHMIFEEAPQIISTKSNRSSQVVTFSARTPNALNDKLKQFIDYFEIINEDYFEDIAYTNNIGRKEFEFRVSIVANSKEESCCLLKDILKKHQYPKVDSLNSKKIAFIFPGYGDEYKKIAQDLYLQEPTFKKHFSICSLTLKKINHIDMADLLFTNNENVQTDLMSNHLVGIALFIIEYALAKTFIEWGIKPDAVLGYSCGEFAAACISGVISLEDAISILADTEIMIKKVSKGKMIALSMPKSDLEPYLNNNISIAAYNGNSTYTIAGDTNSIEQLKEKLNKNNIDFIPVYSDYAFHTKMMKPFADQINERFQNIKINNPELKYLSCVKGKEITVKDLQEPEYWGRIFCDTVKFDEAVLEIVNDPEYTIIEIGASNKLTQFIKRFPSRLKEQVILSCVTNDNLVALNQKSTLQVLSVLWENGFNVDWQMFYYHEKRKKISLPAYPFQRERYWITPAKATALIEKNISTDQQITNSSQDIINNQRSDSNNYLEIKKIVTETWCKLFGVEKIEPNEGFLDLGGNSLIATMLINRLRLTYKFINVSYDEILNNITIDQMTESIKKSNVEYIEESNLKSKNTKSLYTLLIDLPYEKRVKFVEEYIVNAISKTLQIEVDEIKERYKQKSLDFNKLGTQLFFSFNDDFDLPIYEHEILSKPDIESLAKYVIKEIDLKRGVFDDDAKVVFKNKKTQTQIQTQTIKEKNKPMVFLLSCPRSGSTIFRLMLAGHSKLFSPPEIKLLGHSDLREWADNVQRRVTSHGGVPRSFKELMGLSQEETQIYLNSLIEKRISVAETYRLIQDKLGDRMLVDKSPDNAISIESLYQAEEIFDKPKYLHLIRHPYTSIESYVKIKAYTLFVDDVNNPYKVAESDWNRRNGNLVNFLDAIDSDRVFRVKYEDIIKKPKETLTSVCEFLKIPFEDALLTPYDGKRMMDGEGDPNIYNHDSLNPKRADAWKEIRLPIKLSQETRTLSKLFGYYLPVEDELSDNFERQEDLTDNLIRQDFIAEENEKLDKLSNDEVEELIKKLNLLNKKVNE